jgi:hypothetical protein
VCVFHFQCPFPPQVPNGSGNPQSLIATLEHAPAEALHPEEAALGSQIWALSTPAHVAWHAVTVPCVRVTQQTVSVGQFPAPVHCNAMGGRAVGADGQVLPDTHANEPPFPSLVAP